MEIPTENPSPDSQKSRNPTRLPWRWVVGGLFAVVLVIGIGGAVLKVSYVALVPGSARATEDLVSVEGVDVFPSDGEVFFTTVRVRNELNVWEYLWLSRQSEVDIVAESVIFGDRTVEENRQRNARLMEDSKSVAVAVALEELGYDAVVSDGVLVIELVEGGAAAAVLEPFDSIVALNGQPTPSAEDLVELLGGYSPGDEIVLTVEPLPGGPGPSTGGDEDGGDGDGDGGDLAPSKAEQAGTPNGVIGANGVAQVEIPVVLGSRDDDTQAAFLGIAPSDRIQFNTEFDFEVEIDSGNVGGPSAGLAFSLAVLDLLTEGELTGGEQVAVTGTIDSSGGVGSVGGVKQKAAAVRDMGADLFLVPASLDPAVLRDVEEVAGDTLDVVPVETLDDALDVLAKRGGQVDAVFEFAAANGRQSR